MSLLRSCGGSSSHLINSRCPAPWVKRGRVVKRPHPRLLAGRGVGRSQSRVGGSPDTRHAATGANKKRGGRQTDESQKQRIFDQVLALFIVNKVVQHRFHGGSLLPPNKHLGGQHRRTYKVMTDQVLSDWYSGRGRCHFVTDRGA